MHRSGAGGRAQADQKTQAKTEKAKTNASNLLHMNYRQFSCGATPAPPPSVSGFTIGHIGASSAHARENHLRRNARLGIRGLLVYCAISVAAIGPRSAATDGRAVPRLSDIEPRFICQVWRPEGCGCPANYQWEKEPGRAAVPVSPDALMLGVGFQAIAQPVIPAQPTTKTLWHTLAPGVAWPNITPFLIGARRGFERSGRSPST